MIIKQASDLHFTYVRNTPELREAFISKCKEFGILVWGDDDKIGSYLEVFACAFDCDDKFEIVFTDTLEFQSKELFIGDLIDIPTETPEEKEVLDSIEIAGEVEWKNGDLLEFMGEPCVFVSVLNGFPVVKYTEDADRSLAGCFDEIIAVDRLKKPETPQQREDRERLEAAYDLYCEFTNKGSVDATCMSFYDFGQGLAKIKWLAIVDKTKYRKEKTHGTN
ncbi:hypothetical protein MYOV024v1_p0063 [Vibrio phage PS34B.2]|nr:hypothetical protein MYOV024v1_p0063 [Vibrio phage PS34B.2]